MPAQPAHVGLHVDGASFVVQVPDLCNVGGAAGVVSLKVTRRVGDEALSVNIGVGQAVNYCLAQVKRALAALNIIAIEPGLCAKSRSLFFGRF